MPRPRIGTQQEWGSQRGGNVVCPKVTGEEAVNLCGGTTDGLTDSTQVGKRLDRAYGYGFGFGLSISDQSVATHMGCYCGAWAPAAKVEEEGRRGNLEKWRPRHEARVSVCARTGTTCSRGMGLVVAAVVVLMSGVIPGVDRESLSNTVLIRSSLQSRVTGPSEEKRFWPCHASQTGLKTA
jgi:hypothetical protein